MFADSHTMQRDLRIVARWLRTDPGAHDLLTRCGAHFAAATIEWQAHVRLHHQAVPIVAVEAGYRRLPGSAAKFERP